MRKMGVAPRPLTCTGQGMAKLLQRWLSGPTQQCLVKGVLAHGVSETGLVLFQCYVVCFHHDSFFSNKLNPKWAK